jgi:hypothetical protein
VPRPKLLLDAEERPGRLGLFGNAFSDLNGLDSASGFFRQSDYLGGSLNGVDGGDLDGGGRSNGHASRHGSRGRDSATALQPVPDLIEPAHVAPRRRDLNDNLAIGVRFRWR